MAFKAGRLDEAETVMNVAEAASFRWGLFEDTPEQLRRDIQNARQALERDESVKVMAEARKLFTQGNYEEAEHKAYHAQRLHGPYGVFDFGDRPHLSDHYPDTYSITRIGLNPYLEAYRVHPTERTDEIDSHASGIAWKLQGIDPLAEAVMVVALNLLDPVLDAMEIPQDPPTSAKRPFDVRDENRDWLSIRALCDF